MVSDSKERLSDWQVLLQVWTLKVSLEFIRKHADLTFRIDPITVKFGKLNAVQRTGTVNLFSVSLGRPVTSGPWAACHETGVPHAHTEVDRLGGPGVGRGVHDGGSVRTGTGDSASKRSRGKGPFERSGTRPGAATRRCRSPRSAEARGWKVCLRQRRRSEKTA